MAANLIAWGVAGVVVGVFLWRRNSPVKGCRDIDGAELNEMLKQQRDIKIVDVRTPAEFKGGHIPGALSRPLGNLDSWAGEFNQDQALVLVCASGMRSKTAANKLINKGHTTLYNLKGGIGSWQEK
jgi:rhodanese-related sulfurtransferase